MSFIIFRRESGKDEYSGPWFVTGSKEKIRQKEHAERSCRILCFGTVLAVPRCFNFLRKTEDDLQQELII